MTRKLFNKTYSGFVKPAQKNNEHEAAFWENEQVKKIIDCMADLKSQGFRTSRAQWDCLQYSFYDDAERAYNRVF